MKYTKLENSNLNVSRVCLGTWAIGGAMWGAYDEKKAIEAIETSLANGINFIDTAPVYGNGHAEKLIGNIIKQKREQVVLATKCGLDPKNNYTSNLSPDFIQKDLENSLTRLQTEYIDLYQCHWPDAKTPIAKTMEKLNQLKEKGLIHNIGISNFNSEQTAEALKYAVIVTSQPQYSLVERSIETNIQPLCVKNNISIIPYGPLGGGVLTGKYKEWPQFGKFDARTIFYKAFQKKNWPKVEILVNKLKEIAFAKNAKPGNIAVAWLLAKPGVASAIVGARNAEQALDNLTGADIDLNPAEITELDNLSAQLYV